MNRAEMLARLRAESGPWDLLVIGGGATGLGAALDAAARGYRTALLEQADFAQATSSRSTKLIHGGIRYLRQGNLRLVRESMRERALLLRNAPGLVHPLDFIVPVYHWTEGLYYGAGLKLYDWLARGRQPHSSRRLTRDETLARLPTVNSTGLRGGIIYSDAQFDDARLAVTLAAAATTRGAVMLNYVKVDSLLKTGGRITGAQARDVETGEIFAVPARVVLNATGIFTDEIRRLDDPAAAPQLTLSQGAHLVLPKKFLPGAAALLVPKTADGRVLFAVPWHDRVIVGTTDTPVPAAVLEPRAQADEIEFLLAHARRYLAHAPTARDVLSVYAGVRPLVGARGAAETSALSRSHTVTVSPTGLVTITGGKWTTCRQMAEEAVTRAAAVAGLPVRPCVTADLALPGPPRASADAAPAAPLHPALPYTAVDVTRAVRREMARKLEDVLARRTRALFLDARAAMEIAPAVATLMAGELGRDAAWRQQEIDEFLALARGYVLS